MKKIGSMVLCLQAVFVDNVEAFQCSFQTFYRHSDELLMFIFFILLGGIALSIVFGMIFAWMRYK